MLIPDDLKQIVDLEIAAFCHRKVAPSARDKVRLTHKWRGSKVTLIEQYPLLDEPGEWKTCPVAQFRFNSKNHDWTLLCQDLNHHWQIYDEMAGARGILGLLLEVDQDPTGIFWG